MKENQINTKLLQDNEQVIFPLRCVLLKTYRPEVWKKIMELEHHCEERRGTSIWRRTCVEIEPILR